ncbi:hypothetical protein ACIRT4_06510 [Pseudomonas aeruginosa]|uniref:hypothetical protein n=1 Tax=Pseudomonas aeruginosa TaxID=287 RepID=UPI003D9BEC34
MTKQFYPRLTENKNQEPSRQAWSRSAMPAFVLSCCCLTFAILWFGPVAVRDKASPEYEADVMLLAKQLDEAEKYRRIPSPAAANLIEGSDVSLLAMSR